MFNILKDFSFGSSCEQEKELFSIKEGRVGQIVSFGNVSQENFWYEQSEDEWVVVLEGEGEIEYYSKEKILLKKGDSIFIPANKKHRVSYTSSNPPCIWLAIYGQIKMEDCLCTKK